MRVSRPQVVSCERTDSAPRPRGPALLASSIIRPTGVDRTGLTHSLHTTHSLSLRGAPLPIKSHNGDGLLGDAPTDGPDTPHQKSTTTTAYDLQQGT